MANVQEILIGARLAERAAEKVVANLAPDVAERFAAALPEIFGSAGKGAKGIEKSTVDVPQLFDASKVNLDELLPFETRQAMAMRAPTFSAERAAKFKHDMQSVIGEKDPALTNSFKNMLAEQKANGWDDLHYTETMMSTREWNNFNAAVWKAHERIKPVIDNLADDLHIPRPKFQIDYHNRGGASFGLSQNQLKISTDQLAKYYADVPEMAYHEMTHAEQVNLVVRRAADKLSLGQTADSNQLSALLKTIKQDAGVQIADNSYLLECLRLRNGVHLTGEQGQRADALAKSFKTIIPDVFGHEERFHAHQMIEILKASGDQPFSALMSNHGLAQELSGHGYWFGPQGASAVSKKIASDWHAASKEGFTAEQERTAMEQIRRILGNRIDEVNANEMTRFVNYRTSLHEVEAHEAGDQIGSTQVLKLIAQKGANSIPTIPTIPSVPTYTGLQAARQAA